METHSFHNLSIAHLTNSTVDAQPNSQTVSIVEAHSSPTISFEQTLPTQKNPNLKAQTSLLSLLWKHWKGTGLLNHLPSTLGRYSLTPTISILKAQHPTIFIVEAEPMQCLHWEGLALPDHEHWAITVQLNCFHWGGTFLPHLLHCLGISYPNHIHRVGTGLLNCFHSGGRPPQLPGTLSIQLSPILFLALVSNHHP